MSINASIVKRWLVFVIVLLALLSIPTSTVEAQDAMIDLEIGTGGQLPLSIENIKPGDLGAHLIELSNQGELPGEVLIWIEDIGEVDDAGDGANLGRYLEFNMSQDDLVTDLAFPCGIYDMPSSLDEQPEVMILDIFPGKTFQLILRWEFVETGEPQNDAQGDSLSFTIFFLMRQSSSSSMDQHLVEVNVLGRVSTIIVDGDGRVLNGCSANDWEETCLAVFSVGDCVLGENGEIPQCISIQRIDKEDLYPAPNGLYIVDALEIIGYNCTGNCCLMLEGIEFYLHLNPVSFPSSFDSIQLFHLDQTGGWETAEESQVNYIGGILEFDLQESGTYSILMDLSDLDNLEASSLEVSPSVRKIWDPITFATKTGETVTISINLTNTGDTNDIFDIFLMIDGNVLDARNIELQSEERVKVIFLVTGLDNGEHEVALAGLNSNFRVGTDINWFLILSIIIIGCCIASFIYVRNKKKPIQDRLDRIEGLLKGVNGKIDKLDSELVTENVSSKVPPIVTPADVYAGSPIEKEEELNEARDSVQDFRYDVDLFLRSAIAGSTVPVQDPVPNNIGDNGGMEALYYHLEDRILEVLEEKSVTFDELIKDLPIGERVLAQILGDLINDGKVLPVQHGNQVRFKKRF